MKKPKIVLTSFVPIVLALYSVQAGFAEGQSLSRDKALEGVKSCSRSLSEGCNEEAAATLIGYYESGDKDLLKPLLDAGLFSDGALSESLGTFYAEVLYHEPRVFLSALNSLPKKAQHQLARLAGSMDGSGMPKEMLRGVKSELSKVAARRNSRLSSVARLCLAEVSKANRTER